MGWWTEGTAHPWRGDPGRALGLCWSHRSVPECPACYVHVQFVHPRGNERAACGSLEQPVRCGLGALALGSAHDHRDRVPTLVLGGTWDHLVLRSTSTSVDPEQLVRWPDLVALGDVVGGTNAHHAIVALPLQGIPRVVPSSELDRRNRCGYRRVWCGGLAGLVPGAISRSGAGVPAHDATYGGGSRNGFLRGTSLRLPCHPCVVHGYAPVVCDHSPDRCSFDVEVEACCASITFRFGATACLVGRSRAQSTGPRYVHRVR